MQKACEITFDYGAVLNLDDKIVEDICASIDGVVVAANYNCPGQLVISGEYKAVELACEKMKEAGAKRAFNFTCWRCFPLTNDGTSKRRISSSN